jgi:hypothetical protein
MPDSEYQCRMRAKIIRSLRDAREFEDEGVGLDVILVLLCIASFLYIQSQFRFLSQSIRLLYYLLC